MNEVCISIIIPVYNSEKFLHRCVDSVLSQTYNSFELILVDDGSTDSSGKICDEYTEKDKRVKVVHKVNGGVSSARNAGIECASGKYVMFVDSDDFVDSKTLQEMTYNIEMDLDYVACSVADSDEDLKVYSNSIYDNVVPGVFNTLDEIGKSIYFYQGYAIGKFYKLSILNEQHVRFHQDFNIGEDSLFVKEYIIHINSIEVIDKPLYNYVHRKNEHLSGKYVDNVEEIYKYISNAKHKINTRYGLPEESPAVISTLAKIINIYLKDSPYKDSKSRRAFIKPLVKDKKFKHDILHYRPVYYAQKVLKLVLITGNPFLIDKCYSHLKSK